jgi:hypothetical protein
MCIQLSHRQCRRQDVASLSLCSRNAPFARKSRRFSHVFSTNLAPITMKRRDWFGRFAFAASAVNQVFKATTIHPTGQSAASTARRGPCGKPSRQVPCQKSVTYGNIQGTMPSAQRSETFNIPLQSVPFPEPPLTSCSMAVTPLAGCQTCHERSGGQAQPDGAGSY